jgi:glycosyltransferase involved in cell wall biosynthesis
MKVALVHDWLTGMRGGEKVLEIFCQLFPDATLFTLIHHKGSMSPTIEAMNIVESDLPTMPLAHDYFRHYLSLFPRFIEDLDLSGYDLILSSSHCVAKGVHSDPGAIHVCYSHTPMRYVWDMYEEYVSGRGPLVKGFLGASRAYLQGWDSDTAKRVDHFIANSNHVADRISRHYGRSSTVIHPPVDTEYFTPGPGQEGDYYLIVSALVPYKKVDMAVKAFRGSGKELVVIGSGSDEKRIRNLGGENITILGNVDDQQILSYYRGAKAFIFPGEEDFGITPLESMACGTPVIAYRRGGALETVVEGETGLFFDQQTPEALMAAVDNFAGMKFTVETVRARALQFSKLTFRDQISEFLQRRYK